MNISQIISSYNSIIGPLRLHIKDNNGGLLVFFKSRILSRKLNVCKILSNTQIIPFEINLRKEKWLVASIYKAPFKKNKYFCWYLTNLLELYSNWYEDIVIPGDFNIEAENKVMKNTFRSIR